MIQELWKWSLLAICIRNWHFSPYIAGLAAEKQLSWHLSSNQDGHRKAFIISSGCPISFPLPAANQFRAAKTKTIKETKPLFGVCSKKRTKFSTYFRIWKADDDAWQWIKFSRIQIGHHFASLLFNFFSVLAPWALWILTTIIPVGFKNNEASAVSKLDHHRSLNLHRLTGGSRDIKMQIGGKCIFNTDWHSSRLLTLTTAKNISSWEKT